MAAWLVLLPWAWAAWVSVGAACPSSCVCRWKSGRETVECVGLGLAELPAGVGGGTRVLDLSGNSLRALPRDMFVASGLLNLQRIFLASCKIGRVDDNAFSRLTNLVELDLSDNLITAVPTETFKDFPALRRLVLSDNPITRVENGAFLQLPFLTALDMSRCRLDTVMPRGCDGLSQLTSLKLDHNRLERIPARALNQLKGLHGLELHGNSWACDCQLRELRHWLLHSGVPTAAPLLCVSPEEVRGTPVEQVPLEQLACAPKALAFTPRDRMLEAVEGQSVAMLCRVSGVPEPHVRWIRDGRTIANLTRTYMIRENGTNDKVSMLSVGAIAENDAGDYLCIAENSAGVVAANFTVSVDPPEPEIVGLSASQVAGIGVGLAFLALIAVLLLCACVARWRESLNDGGKLLHISHPIQKLPPGKNVPVNALGRLTDLPIQSEQHDLKGSHGNAKPGSGNNAFAANQDHYERNLVENSLNARVVDNKPDVVINVSEKRGGPTDDLQSYPRGLCPLEEQDEDRGMLGEAELVEDKLPDLQESLKYSPQTPPKEGWGEKDGAYDYEALVGADGWHYDLPPGHAHPQYEWSHLHPKSPGFRFRNLVPVLPPFPAQQALRVTHSPDEGYEDEGGEGTEV